MKILTIALLALSINALAEIEKDLSGNFEVQGRQSWNNEKARSQLGQNWDQEQFYLAYGNLNIEFKSENSRVEANWFFRHSYSELYADNFLATRIFTFPQRLIARDILKLEYRKQENNYLTDSVLNKFYFEHDIKQLRFMVGRMYINYGLGEIFNPINPFNQPTGLTSISQVAQGNDGLSVKYFLSEEHYLDFYLLGDKRINNYEGPISKTFWLHGEYQATPNLQVDYVAGHDQDRFKIGSQLSYNFAEALAFTQFLYQTDFLDNKESHPLWDVLLGFDKQLTSKWHVRFEGGYQKLNRFGIMTNFIERFLPTEYFVALANQYEVHPLVNVSGTIINDVKSGFTYFVSRSTFSLGKNTEADIFGYIPVAKGTESDNFFAQNLVTTDIGVALRTFF